MRVRNEGLAVPNAQAAQGFDELRVAGHTGRALIGWAILFSVFINLLMLTGPVYMLQVYDRVLASRSVETLVALSILVAVLYAIMGVLDHARGCLLTRVGARFRSRLDERVFEATVRKAPHADLQAAPSAPLRDLDAVQAAFLSPGLPALFDLPWTPLFIAALFVFHPALGVLALIGAATLLAMAALNRVLAARSVREAQAMGVEAQGLLMRAAAVRETVLSDGGLRPVMGRFLHLRDGALAHGMRAQDRTGVFLAFTRSFRLFLQSAMLGLGAFFVLKGELTAGAMVAGSILLGRALAPLEQTIGHWPVIVRAWSGWKALGAFLGAVPPRPQRIMLPEPEAHLSARGLTVVPPGRRLPVLRNIGFDLAPGTALGVIGCSGSGKSALARALAGRWPLAAGEVRLGGAALEQYATGECDRYIGYLPQTFSLLPGTVAENIAGMAQAPPPEDVIEAAKRANAHDFILRLPNGYDTVLDDRAPCLSEGQRQRIGLACALYRDPLVLILDDPGAMLDAEGAAVLNRMVRDQCDRGHVVIVMTHRPAAIAECGMLMVLEHGKMTALGPRDDVLRDTLRNVDAVGLAVKDAERVAI